MNQNKKKGITLVETLVYISLLALILPPLVISLIRVTRQVSLLDIRNRINTTATLISSELTRDLTESTQIRVSLSTLGSSPSTFVFLDSTGQVVTIDRPSVVVSYSGGNQITHRLRMTKGSSPSFYLTDPDLDVLSWQVDVVNNNASVLTGIRFHIDMATGNQSSMDPYLKARFVSDFTVNLQPQTIQS